MSGVRDFCETILADPDYQAKFAKVEAFLDDKQAVDAYREATALGQDLQQRQHHGETLPPEEINRFEQMRAALFENPLIGDFLDAQRELSDLQATLSEWIGKTIELGRIPEEDEIGNSGCCGGGGGGGCGCH